MKILIILLLTMASISSIATEKNNSVQELTSLTVEEFRKRPKKPILDRLGEPYHNIIELAKKIDPVEVEEYLEMRRNSYHSRSTAVLEKNSATMREFMSRIPNFSIEYTLFKLGHFFGVPGKYYAPVAVGSLDEMALIIVSQLNNEK